MLMKKGFTLSEVMVTLGMLGVLAAILIPTITKAAPDAKKVMFKKSYYTTEQTISELINDDIFYPATATTTVGGVVYQRGFNYTTVTTEMNIPSMTAKFCYLFSQRLNTVGTVNCSTASASNGTFTTSDGMDWTIRESSGFPVDNTKYEGYIVVDVNGSKKPNCWKNGTVSGLSFTNCAASISVPDQFLISIRYDGKLQADPSGAALLENPTDNAK
ncbi:MAG: type II secretion system protein [Candidatus Gastranaerophilaceae bacterium]